eukprot:5694169-Alexandrium_andersonii.AAC.1
MALHTLYWRTRTLRARERITQLKKQRRHSTARVMREMRNTPRLPLEMARKQTYDCTLSLHFRRGAGRRSQLFAGARTGQRARRLASVSSVALSKHAIVGA